MGTFSFWILKQQHIWANNDGQSWTIFFSFFFLGLFCNSQGKRFISSRTTLSYFLEIQEEDEWNPEKQLRKMGLSLSQYMVLVWRNCYTAAAGCTVLWWFTDISHKFNFLWLQVLWLVWLWVNEYLNYGSRNIQGVMDFIIIIIIYEQ